MELHQWADGRLELKCEGKSLPYTIVDERPDIAPGEVVERKRVAEIVAEIGAQQRRGGRSRPGQSWLRDKPAVPPPKPPPRPAEEAVIEVVARDGDVQPEVAKRFVVRWVRRKAFLYERSVRGSSAAGRPILEDKLLGPVDAEAAQQWQTRGDWSVPPPLQMEEPPARTSRSGPLLAPTPTPPVNAPSRLNAALWMADTFRAQQMEKYRAVDDALADEEFMAQFRHEEEPPNAPAAARAPTAALAERGAVSSCAVVEEGQDRRRRKTQSAG